MNWSEELHEGRCLSRCEQHWGELTNFKSHDGLQFEANVDRLDRSSQVDYFCS